MNQGDPDGIEGLYLINAVDKVTQIQAIFAVAGISERFRVPLQEPRIDTSPFVIKGFHSENGSESINHTVAKLPEQPRIEQTKTCARKTRDNVLVESQNGSTVRKVTGYSHIPDRFAAQLDDFTRDVRSGYLNFHRPCHIPTASIDTQGRLRKYCRYEGIQTPSEKLKSLIEASLHLKPGIPSGSSMPLPLSGLEGTDCVA